MKKTDYLSTLFVGIDIGSRTNVVSAIDFNREYFIRMKPVPNAKEGAEILESLLVDVLSAHHEFKHVIIGMESTGFYGVHIANYLSQKCTASIRKKLLNTKNHLIPSIRMMELIPLSLLTLQELVVLP